MPTKKNIETPEEFRELADSYFDQCRQDDDPLTMTGLVLHLGFCSRQSLYDYGLLPEYKSAVARAKLMVEHGYELKLHSEKVVGPIFALKNFGWSDKQEIITSEKVVDNGENAF